MTPNGMRVLEKRYLLKNDFGKVIETPDELYHRVAQAMARGERKEKANWTEKFYEMMAASRFLPNSPTLMNAGKPGGQLSACFVLPILDSLDSIFDSLKFAAKIHQSGGGTGFSFSQVRQQGSRVQSTQGVASGPVSFIKIFDAATETVKQGGTRRGANMAVLRVDHPDILQFVDAKVDMKSMTNFNISVGVTDEFMEAVENNDDFFLKDPRTRRKIQKIKAIEVFNKLTENAWTCGDPGLVFLDRINLFNSTPQEGRMESTNPCVSGNTRIPVEGKGMIPIRELLGSETVISTEHKNRNVFHAAGKVICSGVKPVFRLQTFEGYELSLTEEHRVMTDRGDVEAKDLELGDKIRLRETNPPRPNFDSQDSGLGEVLGWLTGDGHFTNHGHGKKTAVLSFYGADKIEAGPHLLKMVQLLLGKPQLILSETEARDKTYIRSQRLRQMLEERGVDDDCKKKVPEIVWRGSVDLQAGYLRGIFSADGSRQGKIEKELSVRLASNQLEILSGVQQLLLGLGMRSVLYKDRRVAQFRWMPDSKQQLKEYACSTQHELVLSKDSITTFGKVVGFLIAAKQARLIKSLEEYNRGPDGEPFYATFKELVFEGEEEVYDLNEPISSHFHADGLLIHNCGEQPLLPFESCNLGSLNLGLYASSPEIKKFNWNLYREDIHAAVRFLDNVIEQNHYPLLPSKKITLKNRKIGLGVMGFADLLLKMEIPYSSQEAVKWGELLMSFLDREAKAASHLLAVERGAFPNWKGSLWHQLGYPILRNATVSTVAPTGTISMIAGASSGIEPIFSGVFYRNVLSGDRLVEVHPTVQQILESRGLKASEITDEVIDKELGSIWSPSRRIAVEQHVKIQAAFQRHSDSAVSKTVNLPQHAKVDDVKKAYLMAHHMGCKGITVYRDQSRPTQVLDHSVIVSPEPEGSGVCPDC